MKFLIIHQVDLSAVAGGIDTFIADVVGNAPHGVSIKIYGARRNRVKDRAHSSDGTTEYLITLRGRRRFVPDTLRLGFALLPRWRSMQRYDIIQIHRMEFAPLVRILSPKAKIQLFIHTPTAGALSQSSDSLWRRLRSLNKFWEGLALRSSDQVFCFSKQETDRLTILGVPATSLMASFDGRIFFAHEVPAGEGSAPPQILWVGRFEAPKDPHLAIAVAAELEAQGTSVSLVMIGDGALASELERASRGMANVRIFPSLPHEEIAEVMRRSRVLLSTSVFEGAPRVLVEALACALPIVTASGADPEGLADRDVNSRSVPNRSCQGLASAITEVLDQPRPSVAPEFIENRKVSRQIEEIMR